MSFILFFRVKREKTWRAHHRLYSSKVEAEKYQKGFEKIDEQNGKRYEYKIIAVRGICND